MSKNDKVTRSENKAIFVTTIRKKWTGDFCHCLVIVPCGSETKRIAKKNTSGAYHSPAVKPIAGLDRFMKKPKTKEDTNVPRVLIKLGSN